LPPDGSGHDDGDGQQAEPAPKNGAETGSAAGLDDDPEPQPARATSETAEAADSAPENGSDKPKTEEEQEVLAATVVPGGGAWGGKTLADVYATQDGREWIVWALRNKGRLDEGFYVALVAFVAHHAAQGDA
jgi:hypothetical protein